MSATAEKIAPAWAEEDLHRLRQLVKTEETSAWEIGDCLLELLPVGRVGVATGVGATIRRLAAEVDSEPQTLTAYRKVAHAWPKGSRIPFATWRAHQAYMGPPATANARAQTLNSLPRNEHGKITVQAVKEMTKGGGRARPGWHELLGQVSDALARAEKQLDRFEDATADRELNEKLRTKASDYALQAEQLAIRLRQIGERA